MPVRPHDANPYAPPEASLEGGPAVSSEAEATRRVHLTREATVVAAGSGFLFVAYLMTILFAFHRFMLTAGLDTPRPGSLPITLWLGLDAFLAVLGFGLLGFRPWARRATVSALVMSIPLLLIASAARCATTGAIDGDAGCGLVLAAAGSLFLTVAYRSNWGVVFTEGYRSVIAETPHIRSRASRLLRWGYLSLAGLVTLLILLAATFIARNIHLHDFTIEVHPFTTSVGP